MGKFGHCLGIRLEMNSPQARTRASYRYAQGLGLVAYRYEAWAGTKERPEVEIQASLKLAQVAGQTMNTAADLEKLRGKIAGGPVMVDDPEARKLFRRAYEQLYTWPTKFPGFQADFTLAQAGVHVKGTVTVSPELKMKVAADDKRAGQQVEAEISQFVAHLRDQPFETKFGAAALSFGEKDAGLGTRINVSGEGTMGTGYQVKEGTIHQISHSYGRVRFVVNHTDFLKSDDGRLLATSYRITYYSNETHQVVDDVEFKDEFAKVGDLWLPKKRVKTDTAKGQTTVVELELSNHRVIGK
jgi:hypothetical protein